MLLVVNSLALASVTFLEWRTGTSLQDEVYLLERPHPSVARAPVDRADDRLRLWHLAKARGLPNRDAAKVGHALFAAAIGLLATGVLLMEIEIAGVPIGVRRAGSRELATGGLCAAGRRRVALRDPSPRRAADPLGGRLARGGGGGGLCRRELFGHVAHRCPPLDPTIGEASEWLDPSLARTRRAMRSPLRTLQMNEYCLECHEDTYHRWVKLGPLV